MYFQLIYLFITFYLNLFVVQSTMELGTINSWCDQTPYPETCKYYLCPQEGYCVVTKVPKNKFRDLLIGVTKNLTLEAVKQIENLGTKSFGKEKIAWSDCSTLYKSTILQLEKSRNKTTFFTGFDSQIWLSAALTNLDTCRDGFTDIGATQKVLPFISNNVSFLVIDSLAINKPESKEMREERGFPSWISHGDLRMLRKEKNGIKPDLVVAKDGSGDFKTIADALKASTKRRDQKRFVIYVKKGIYKEYVVVDPSMEEIMLIGDGIGATIVTGNRSVSGGYTTFSSATVSIKGDGFIARDITFSNTAGPNTMAVALVSVADHSVFYNCSFEGYQDTLYVHSQRQFYRQCQVYGTTDFIFGNAAVVFQNSFIYARQPTGDQVTITAQSRSNPNQTTGFSLDRCIVAPDKNRPWPHRPFVAYLGRPWREYARVAYLISYLDAIVPPEGWSTWGSMRLDKLYYGEYGNYGKGSSTKRRVKWPGYHDIKDIEEARRFSVQKLLRGEAWLPSTGVPFNPDIWL